MFEAVLPDEAPPRGRPSPLGSSHPSHRFVLPVRLVLLVVGIGLFVVALGLMKAGAQALVPALEGSIFTDGLASALGLGWLGACLVLSGSPVAASALTLLDGGAIDRDQAFAMLTGSRLGASFVVLAVGAIYTVRKTRKGDDDPKAPLSIGILSFTMTAVAYLPGALLGLLVLRAGWLDGVHLAASPDVVSVTDTAFGWAVDGAKSIVPDWALFPLGVLVLLGAFKVVDEVLPSVGEESVDHRSSRWFSTPWLMFALGCLVAFLTLSVSVALTVLVPIVASGRLKREDALPYIAGANITTLADTLVAAVVLGNQDAVRVVLAEAGGVTVWTLFLLAFLYPQVKAFCLAVSDAVLESKPRLVGFVSCLFVVPLVLIAV
jgi:sodium-dependent phosphate cotransporter